MVEDQTSFINAPSLHQPLFSSNDKQHRQHNVVGCKAVYNMQTLECIKKTRIMIVLLDTESSNEIV